MKKIIGLFFVILLSLSYTYTHAQLGGITTIASVDSGGMQINNSATHPSISINGRYIAFSSHATNLIANDTNGYTDIFVHDNLTGETTIVSVASDGTQSDFNSGYSSISDDGRFIAFVSIATNLVADDTNSLADVFVHDRQTGQTTRVSVASDGTQGNGNPDYPIISGDGRFISFESAASNLVANDTNNATDIFVHDRQTGQTTRVSVASDGTQADNSSALSYISEDGRYIAFGSGASNLVPDDTNSLADAFVHDRQTGQTTRVSVASDGTQSNGNSGASSLSNDGRYVLIYSGATNLVTNDTNDFYDIFVHDRQTGQTTRVSVASDGTQSNNTSSWSDMSGDGRYVTFDSHATNLIANDTNGYMDVFVHDRQTTLAVELSGNATSISEMNGGTHAVTSISLIVKGGISFIPVTIDCILTDGSATLADTDYTQTNATITIPAGDYTTPTTITIPIATLGIMGDTKVESNETLSLTLQNPSTNIMIGDANGDLITITSTVYTILNDDVASITLNNVTLAEGNSGITNFIFTATLDNAVQGGFTVNYMTNDGSATVANNDYANTTGILTFVGINGETQIITVPINGDTILEADETFTVSLDDASSMDITITSIGIGTILNDEPASIMVSINEQMLFNAIIPHQVSEIEFILPDIHPSGILITMSFTDNAVATVEITFTVTDGMITMTLNTPTFQQGYSSIHEATIYQNLIPIIMMAFDDLLGSYDAINSAILNTSDIIFTFTTP